MHMKELPMFTYNNLWMGCLHPDTSYVSYFVLLYQHCDEQQFQTLSCAHYTIFSIILIKLDLVIQALLLDYILALKKRRVRLACVLFLNRNQYFWTFLRQNIQQKVLVFHRTCKHHMSVILSSYINIAISNNFKHSHVHITQFFQ